MSNAGYPRERVDDVLERHSLSSAYRLIPSTHRDTPLGVGAGAGDSRFCTAKGDFNVLYAASSFETAFIEVIVRDRFTRSSDRRVGFREVRLREWVRFSSKKAAKLNLLDLRDDGCLRLGAPTDAARARNHAAGRALGQAIYSQYPDVDGFLFASRLTGRDIYAIFDRAVEKLKVVDTGNAVKHPKLPGILSRHRIDLVR